MTGSGSGVAGRFTHPRLLWADWAALAGKRTPPPGNTWPWRRWSTCEPSLFQAEHLKETAFSTISHEMVVGSHCTLGFWQEVQKSGVVAQQWRQWHRHIIPHGRPLTALYGLKSDGWPSVPKFFVSRGEMNTCDRTSKEAFLRDYLLLPVHTCT